MQLNNSWAAGPKNMYKMLSVRKILGAGGVELVDSLMH